jgi:hypothetical protein
MVGAINAWSLVDVLKVRPLLDQVFFHPLQLYASLDT